MSGLTDQGLQIETVETIRDSINADWRGKFGPSVDVSDESPDGFLIGIVSERLGLLWELLEDVDSSQDPDKATGAAQDALCALTGTLRLAAAPSTATLLMIGDAGTVVASGSRAKTVSTAKLFKTTADTTLVAATLWAASTAYTVGAIRANASRIYLCITSGTSAGSGGPTTTATDITDGTAHWRYLGEGLATASVAGESVDTGPVVGVAYDIAAIDTPVSGWRNVTNLLDAALGRNLETNEELRVRREAEIAAQGEGTIEAIRSDMLRVTGVTSATVFYNNTDVTDSDGVPPHSVEVLVQGGADQDIRDQLLQSVAAGIRTYGGVSGTAADSQGTLHTIAFSRPTEIPIWIIATVHKDATTYPADGDAQIKQKIAAWGNALANGRDVRANSIAAQAFGVDGVLDVPSLPLIGTSNPPTVSTTIAVSTRQRATYDTSRITVNSSSVTP